MLVLTSDLSSISKQQFRMLCQLFNGIATELSVDGKAELRGVINQALTELSDVHGGISHGSFTGETLQTRLDFLRKLGREAKSLRELANVIEKLDDRACIALLIRIEEVYAGDGFDLEDRCTTVFEKTQGRRQS